MLQYRIDAPDFVTAAHRVMRRHHRFQPISPVHRAGLVLRINFRQVGMPACLCHPEFELGFVGVETDRCSHVGAANALFSDRQPLVTVEVVGLDEFEGRLHPGGFVCFEGGLGV